MKLPGIYIQRQEFDQLSLDKPQTSRTHAYGPMHYKMGWILNGLPLVDSCHLLIFKLYVVWISESMYSTCGISSCWMVSFSQQPLSYSSIFQWLKRKKDKKWFMSALSLGTLKDLMTFSKWFENEWKQLLGWSKSLLVGARGKRGIPYMQNNFLVIP